LPVLVGTSGWQYAHWKARFYPTTLPQKAWLEHYSERFGTVEVNNAFYRLPEKKTFEDWRNRTPPDFVLAVKASRYLTHIKRLREPAEPVKRLLERASGLKEKLGPILLQLPPNLRVDLAALEETLSQFPSRVRVAFEPRHDSWFCDDTAAILAEHGAALCLTDIRGKKSPLWRTADWGYLRMHAGRASPQPCYGRRALETWSRTLAKLWDQTSDLYVYFNNDERACALDDSRMFAMALAKVGLEPSRVPDADEVSVDRT
jgi:uncharacterized protein YecE (DUF72 family)